MEADCKHNFLKNFKSFNGVLPVSGQLGPKPTRPNTNLAQN